jgi:molybdopterin biosynthesis enzyme
MIGYHDAYKPQVSVGEILQQRMAAISQMAIHESEQRRLAVDVLSELKIPQEQHAAWLEAF